MTMSQAICGLVLCSACGAAGAETLPRIIDSVKQSVVGIGSVLRTRSPALTFVGTGFVVGDGLTVLTAAHVVQKIADSDSGETIGILTGRGDNAQFRSATLAGFDKEHDLAQLRLSGAPLPAMQLGDSGKVSEGQIMAFTGFPLGMVLGLHHVTHRAMISAITPVIMPSMSARSLDAARVGQLQRPVYGVFQLDATAYPGSSGSPLYDAETGLVYGIVNMVYVKGLKESAVSAPSGITYAIPGNYIRDMLQRK